MWIRRQVEDAGGVLPRRDLLKLGARDVDLAAAVGAGEVARARRGWYTTFPPDDPRFVALSVGGRVTGAAALAPLGAWMWNSCPPVTVSVPRSASRLHRTSAARVVFDPPEVVDRGTYDTVDLRDALARAVLEADFEDAVALWDWAISSGRFDGFDLDLVESSLPSDAHGISTWCDEKCESFLESVVRSRFVRQGFTVTSQAPVGKGQRIDLVLNDVLGVEVDGREFHAETFTADRRKDLAIVLEGRSVLRLSYEMVCDDWPRITLAAERAIELHRLGGRGPARNQARWLGQHSSRSSRRLTRSEPTRRRRRQWRCLRLARHDATRSPQGVRPPRQPG